LDPGPPFLIQTEQALDGLPQYGQAHGEVYPVQQMLGLRVELCGEGPDRLAAIRQKRQGLRVLYALCL